MKKPTPTRGRPRKPAASLRSVRITAKLTPSEAEELKRRAAADERTVSDFIIQRCTGGER